MDLGVRFRYGWEASEKFKSWDYEITDADDALDPRPNAALPCAGYGGERGELRRQPERCDGGPPGHREAARHGCRMVRLGRRGAYALRIAFLRLDLQQPQLGALPPTGSGVARGWARAEAGRHVVCCGAGRDHSDGPHLPVARTRRRGGEAIRPAAGRDRQSG